MKTLLYTGARSGIAINTINKIINDDFYIYLTVHTDKQLEYIKEKYKDKKNIKCLKLDITNKNDRKILEELDIDVLVNNAAIGEGGSLTEIDMNRVRHNFEVNVFSSFEIVQIALKKMLEKDSGKIIIMSSLASIIPINFLGSYCGTKASISQMTRTLKNEIKLLSNNIKVVLIEPGMYHTGFNQVMLDNKMDINSYFDKQIMQIRKKENFIFGFLEKKNYNSISNKIVKAIRSNNPKFIYRAPCLQAIGTKIYNIFR